MFKASYGLTTLVYPLQSCQAYAINAATSLTGKVLLSVKDARHPNTVQWALGDANVDEYYMNVAFNVLAPPNVPDPLLGEVALTEGVYTLTIYAVDVLDPLLAPDAQSISELVHLT